MHASMKYACALYNEEMAIKMVKSGVNVNVHGDYGYMPIHYACEAQMVGLVRALLGAKSEVNSTTQDIRFVSWMTCACTHDHIHT